EAHAAPEVPYASQQRGWVFVLAPHVDLWFHGMATVDPVGPGPNPLYAPSYPAAARDRKAAAGLGQTPLDQRAAYFRDAFRRDPAMEVLHFLPLYFPDAGRVEFLQALETLAVSREEIPRAPSPRTQFGLTAVGSVLSSTGQRALLGGFISVLREEWDDFLAEDRRARLAGWEETRAAVQGLWDGEFGPALFPLLRGLHLTAGAVFLTPAIGPEGRIFSGIPSDPSDNVLAVSTPNVGDDPRAAVFSMIREFSFPMARRALGSEEGSGQNRAQTEGLAARAAIRAGALALDRLLPQELPAYQQYFLSRAGRSAPSPRILGAAFQDAYPLDEGQISALREVVNTTITNGGEE
ncbi:MAG: hypothetical protein ACWGSQ_13910, partial [Longimicrobiales bacterium]